MNIKDKIINASVILRPIEETLTTKNKTQKSFAYHPTEIDISGNGEVNPRYGGEACAREAT